MSGQLVIAELEAFRSVLGKAKPSEGDTIRLWARSTITNALHRIGPTDAIHGVAARAISDADAFAAMLDSGAAAADLERARDTAVQSLAALVTVIRTIKPMSQSEGLEPLS